MGKGLMAKDVDVDLLTGWFRVDVELVVLLGVWWLSDRLGGDVVDVDLFAGFRGLGASGEQVRVSIKFATHASQTGTVKATGPTNTGRCKR